VKILKWARVQETPWRFISLVFSLFDHFPLKQRKSTRFDILMLLFHDLYRKIIKRIQLKSISFQLSICGCKKMELEL